MQDSRRSLAWRVAVLVTSLSAVAASVMCGSVVAVADEAGAGAKVVEVRFEGLNRTSTAYAGLVVRTKAGEPYDSALADEDVTRLLATGKFAAATVDAREVEGGVAVTFVVRERAVIASIGFVGNVKFTAGKLRKEVSLQPGDPVDLFRIREGQDGIEQVYRDAGYGMAKVTYDADLLDSTGQLVYQIEEGPRIRVRNIRFEGTTAFTDRKLKSEISTKAYVLIFRDGNFDEDAVEADAATLQRFYRTEGYLDARVSYRLEYQELQQDLDVVFQVDEGVRYRIESIAFSGNSVFEDAELLEVMSQKVGAAVLPDWLDRDARKVKEYYGASGYIYASVRPVRVFSEEPGLVQITFEIREGEQYSVGRIVPRGNERTQDKVVRRALDLYPGEVFDLTKLKDCEQSLQATRVFGRCTATPVGSQPNVRDVLITVDETPKAGDFVFGFGVTSNSGLVGSIVLDLKNFDLFDTPRNLTEFLRLRSFHGAGQRLRIEAQPGTELSRFRLDFTEPYLMDKPVRLDTSAYVFDRERESYQEQRLGANVSLGKRLHWEPLKDWFGEVAVRAENVRLDDLELFAARDIRHDEGSHLITSMKASLVRDRTDNRFIPTRGDMIRVSYEQFGMFGGEVFGKLMAGYSRHFTLRTDLEERKSVLSVKSNVGYIVGDAPVFERFYAGGIGSIRGFQFRGVSPRQGLEDDAIGGELMVLMSAEYSFPLYSDVLRGVVFSDMGTVESGFELTQWRASVGVGARLQVDFFGPVPLEFDLAIPVLKDTLDEDQIFSFSIGMTF